MTRLTAEQQRIAADAIKYCDPVIAQFLKVNNDLRRAARRVDLASTAMYAVCLAATTYDPEKSKPSTYFSIAIRHALIRAVLKQQKIDGRYIAVESLLEPSPNVHRTRQEQRALKALKSLSAYDKTLLEDRLIEAVTLEQLGLEQRLDPRTVAKRVAMAIDKLRRAEDNLP
jgi:RNA polymerase sigma factor (sigma-70 family)